MEKTQKKNMLITILGYLFAAFFGAALSYFVWPQLMKSVDINLFGTAEVAVNINELEVLQETQHLEKFSILFGTANNTGWIAAVKVGHKDLNKLFGETLVPEDFGEFGNLEYNVTITNTGKRTAKNIRLSFDGNGLETNQERDVSKNIDFINCGFGHFCEVRIKELRKGEKAAFFVRAESYSAQSVRHSMDSVGDISVNYRNFYVKKITKKESFGMALDGRSVQKPPTINESSTQVSFLYKPREDRWIPMNKQSLQFILEKEGLSFDISSIPDGATIDSYVVDYDDPFGPKVIVEHSE